MSDLGWATYWCSIITKCRDLGRSRWALSAFSEWLEGRVHSAGRYIIVTRPTIFVVARVAKQLARLALRARRMGVVDMPASVRNHPSHFAETLGGGT